ncbi:aminoacyl-tRNA hydrolase [Candidatus Saccharibacteria bacterium]|nr:aminoacyl-tRNA hydrolase [Candidatus Saccharibacteria bacterium]
MKMVVGLGNPGGQYNFTRHNFGFLAVDYYFVRYKASWVAKPFLGAITGRIDDVLFVKPQEFYNLSGRSVAAIARYYKVAASDILVVCDNFDLEFGKMRLRTGGSAGGNNGLKSVDAELGTTDYARLRLGTGNAEMRRKMGDTDFVLSRFTPEEKEALPGILEAAAGKIEEWIRG